MPQVEFSNVGRSKLTWVADMVNVDEASLIKEIRSKKVILSRDIVISGGKIFVGLRTVGYVAIKETA